MSGNLCQLLVLHCCMRDRADHDHIPAGYIANKQHAASLNALIMCVHAPPTSLPVLLVMSSLWLHAVANCKPWSTSACRPALSDDEMAACADDH